jgi:hypothetical protein
MDSATRLGTLLARERHVFAAERDGRLLRVASLSGGGLSAAVVASASRSMHVAAISGVRRTAFCLLRDDVPEASVAEPVVWAVRRRRGLVRDPILGAERRLRVLGRVFVLGGRSPCRCRDVHADRVARGAGVSRSTSVRRTSLQIRPADEGGSRYAPAGLLDQHGAAQPRPLPHHQDAKRLRRSIRPCGAARPAGRASAASE